MSLMIPHTIAFLSGMCALVYEILWMRAFTPVFGLSIYSTTAVLCAFMAGLGLGSILSPRLIGAWKRSHWLLYAILECGIGFGALLIPFSTSVVSDAFVAAAGLDDSGLLTSAVRFGLAFQLMVVPTFFMGMTLPVMVHALMRSVGSNPVTAQRVGTLYGLNTVGGAAGCILVGFVLIPALGVRGATVATVALNLSLASVVYLMYGRAERLSEIDPQSIPVTPAEDNARQVDDAPRMSPALILVLYALVGFSSFGYEMVWFRMLIFFLQSATYSFSIMLALFLLGLGSGSLLFSRIIEPWLDARRSLETARALGLTQMLIAILGLTSFQVYSHLTEIWSFLLSILGASSWGILAVQKAIVAGAVIIPPTIVMGIAFPLTVRLYKAQGANDTKSISYLYAANTSGSILGTLITGLVLFDVLGIQPTMSILTILSFAIGIGFTLPALKGDRRFLTLTAATATLFSLLYVMTPPDLLRRQFEKVHGDLLYYNEGAADITYVYRVRGFAEKGLALGFADGRGVSSTRFVQNYVNRQLAYSTMLMKPDAVDVLVISMGCGNTSSTYLSFPIRRLDIVDISSAPFEAASYFKRTNHRVLEDPRVHTHVEDGRNFLLRTDKKYDIIELEPPTLHTDGVVNLYTREFYEIAHSKLKPGGVLSQWIDAQQTEREPSYMVYNTMLEVFPESTMWASRWAWWANGVKDADSTLIEYERIQPVFDTPGVRRDMRSVRTGLVDILSNLVSSGEQLRETVAGAPIITDDQTIVDFLVPKLQNRRALGGGLGYSSPLRTQLMESWNAEAREERAAPVFPFHAPNDHKAKAADAIRATTSGFPEPIVEGAVKKMARRKI